MNPYLAMPLGLLWGSFVGVMISRVPKGDSALIGRSRCDSCGRQLSVRDLVPVVSVIAQRGRCRTCGSKITICWSIIEVANAVLFAVAAAVAADRWVFALLAPFLGTLLGLSVIDLRHHRLPNSIVYPSAIMAVAVVGVGTFMSTHLRASTAAAGALAFGGGLLMIALLSGGGMGLGDVKLGALIGLVIGAVNLPSVAVAAATAVLLGGVVALVALMRGAGRRNLIPFGPMLAAGALIAVLAGPNIASAYLKLVQ